MKQITLALVLGLLGPIGCGTIPRNPVPVEQIPKAEIPGMPGVRSFGVEHRESFYKDLVQSVRDEPPGLFPKNPDGTKPYAALILSGGGQNGAFGAGFLTGWAQAGTRPTFKIVTGVSAGALIAPFAFVGPDYDDDLKAIFTSLDKKDIVKTRLGREALGNTKPLDALIAQHFTEDMLQKVAAEHARGRRLYIGTTHMDAQRFMVWNMGAIARSGHPDSFALFRKVVLASTSIPIFMPPVMFEIEVDGKRYDEMHADGGVVSNLFFITPTADMARARQELGIKAGGTRIYIIRNGRSDPEPEQVERSLKDITPRTINTVTKFQTQGAIAIMYYFAKLNKNAFNYVEIPASYEKQEKGMFNTAEMNRLYDIGLKVGASPNPWRTKPAFIEAAEKKMR